MDVLHRFESSSPRWRACPARIMDLAGAVATRPPWPRCRPAPWAARPTWRCMPLFRRTVLTLAIADSSPAPAHCVVQSVKVVLQFLHLGHASTSLGTEVARAPATGEAPLSQRQSSGACLS